MQTLSEHDFEVEREGLPLVDDPAGGMREDVHLRMPHRREDPRRLLLRRQVEPGVHAHHDQVQLLQPFLLEIERPVGEDVHFHRAQEADLVVPGHDLVDLLPLPGQLLGVHSAGHRQGLRVVREREVLVALRRTGLEHLLDRVLPVRPGGVHLQVAAHVFEPDQVRERPLLRRLDLAPVLAQLGRDPRQAQHFVDFFFGAARYPLASLVDVGAKILDPFGERVDDPANAEAVAPEVAPETPAEASAALPSPISLSLMSLLKNCISQQAGYLACLFFFTTRLNPRLLSRSTSLASNPG